jgi:hypothetical protein
MPVVAPSSFILFIMAKASHMSTEDALALAEKR